MKIIQSRNQREGGYQGKKGFFGRNCLGHTHSRAGNWAPHFDTLKQKKKERVEWERKLASAKTPEERSAMIQSRAYNSSVERQDQFGEAFFPTVVITP